MTQSKRESIAVVVLGAAVIILCVIFIVLMVRDSHKRAELREHYDRVSGKYEILLDGIKVDADNINVDWYRIEIDDEAGKVLLTPKKG